MLAMTVPNKLDQLFWNAISEFIKILLERHIARGQNYGFSFHEKIRYDKMLISIENWVSLQNPWIYRVGASVITWNIS